MYFNTKQAIVEFEMGIWDKVKNLRWKDEIIKYLLNLYSYESMHRDKVKCFEKSLRKTLSCNNIIKHNKNVSCDFFNQ